jgi:hypothetical protein
MRVDSTGNVGIGTTGPTYRLQLPNVADATGQGQANAWQTYSDASLKDDVSTITNALDDVLALRGVDFTWKGQGVRSSGFIAQEVEKILPVLVSTDVNGIKSLDYGRFTPYLVEAMKTQQGLIIEQQTVVNKINSVIDLTNAATSTPAMAIDGFGAINIGNVATSSPQGLLNVAGNVAAQGFVNISTREEKTNIEYYTLDQYDQALAEIMGAKVAAYDYVNDESRSSTPQKGVELQNKRLGLIAEEAPSEVLSADGKGVDLYKMVSLAWAGIKAQQNQIDQLKMDMEEIRILTSNFQLPTSNSGGLGFASVINAFKGIGMVFENGIARFQQVIAKSFTIQKPADSTQATVGEGAIPAGQTQTQIQSSKIKADSKIFVTFRGDYGSRWWIDSQTDGSAVIKIAQPLSNDVKFDWWVVGVSQENSNDQVPMINQAQNPNDQLNQPSAPGSSEGSVSQPSQDVAPPAEEQNPGTTSPQAGGEVELPSGSSTSSQLPEVQSPVTDPSADSTPEITSPVSEQEAITPDSASVPETTTAAE